jgi:hypothetical protein
LTKQLQAEPKNINSKVTVNDVSKLPNGNLAVNYECNDVSDHESAKTTLNDAVTHKDFIKTVLPSPKDVAREFILLFKTFIFISHSIYPTTESA